MAGSRTEKHTAVYRNVKRCEFHNIGDYIVVTSIIGGTMEDELCLLTYAVLACLKGLKEQGCNGPVTEAIGKIEKHINQKAHGQET